MKSLSAALLLTALSTTLSHAQGSLTPPPGAPAPTMKTLDQVEARTAVNATATPGDASSLFKITQPGSYYLTGNITGATGKTGLSITAAGVSLDLNGFVFRGPVAGNNENGISIEADGVSVRNGTISGWKAFGILGSGGLGGSFSHLTLSENGTLLNPQSAAGGGIIAGGASAIADCLFIRNGTSGLLSNANGLTVSRCTARGNGQRGFYLNAAGTISQCTAPGNSIGFELPSGSVATGCSATENLTFGFLTWGTLVDCSACYNKEHGIKATGGANIRGCTASYNGVSGAGAGITATNRCIIENCMADTNQADGINVDTHCAVRHCHATSNKADGISAGIYAMIENCAALNNGGDGIETAGGSLVRECTAMKNGTAGAAAGIRVTGSGSRIEGNSARDNTGTGILATAGDVIIRNNSAVNSVTNYNPASGNSFAPVQSPATQTNPNANF